MMSERGLVDAIFKAVLSGTDTDIEGRRGAIWIAGVTLLADVLLRTDPFNRERLLRGLVSELRESTDRLSELLPGRKLN
jgi:hypothetical protein